MAVKKISPQDEKKITVHSSLPTRNKTWSIQPASNNDKDQMWQIQLQVGYSGGCLIDIVQDTIQERRSIAHDFRQRCEQILCEAMKWAPGSTHGHLLEYVRKTNSTSDRSIHLTIDSVLASASKPSTDPALTGMIDVIK